MTALCASVQNYTDDAMPENEEAPADEAPGKAEDKDDDKDKDEEEDQPCPRDYEIACHCETGRVLAYCCYR